MNFDIAIIGGGPAGYTAAERGGRGERTESRSFREKSNRWGVLE